MVILWLYGYYMVLRLRMLAMLASAAAVRCLHCGQLLLRRAPAGAQGRPPQQEQGRALGAEGDGGFDHATPCGDAGVIFTVKKGGI